jgi:hypothetical protein
MVMHVDAFICDAVTVREGLLHVLGAGIASLTRREFPAPLAVSLALVLSAEDAGTYDVSVDVKLEGSDAVIGNVTGPIVATASSPPGDGVVVPFPAGFAGVRVPGPGKYLFEISVNGTLLRTLWFRVREM